MFFVFYFIKISKFALPGVMLISRAERKTIVTDIFMNFIFLHIFVPFCDVHVPSNFH